MNRLVGVAAGIAFVAVLLTVPLASASAQNPPTIDSGPASGAAINNTMPTFAFSSPTATEYYCSVDSPTTPTALCTSPFTTPSLPEGTHTFYVVASDTVDTSATTSSSFTVDTTAPILTLTSATLDEPSYTGPVAVNYGATASDGTGSGIASFSCSPLSGSPFSLGSTPVTCNATDNAGNPASGSLTVTVTDTTPPPVPNITGGPTGPTTATAPSFTFSAAGAVGFKCSIDNPSPATPCDGGTFTTSSLGDAPHIFRVVAIDFAGNTSAAAQQAFTVDTTPPPVPAVTGPTGGANSFTFSSNGATSFKCGVGQPTPTTPCSSPFAVGAIPDGSYTFYVTAADALGNTSTAGTRPFTVDTTPPPVPDITSGPAGPTSDRTPSFAFSSSGAAAFKCSIDNLPPTTACNGGSFTAATLTDGTHIFYVTALDAVLNTSAAASRAFTVDATPPDTSISTSIPATIASTSLSIAFTAIGGPATFECKIDAGSFSACPSPFLATGLADGSHTFSVRATDSVGNTDPTPATVSWAVDATPPALTGPGNLAVEANGPSGTAVSYAVTGSDGGLALLPNQITCSPPSGTTFPLGTTTVTCTVSDAVGNIGSVSFSVTVADTTAPGINAPDASFTATSAAGIARTDPAIAAYLAGISGTDLVSAVTLKIGRASCRERV